MKRLIYIVIGSVLTLILYGCAAHNRDAAIRQLQAEKYRVLSVYETEGLNIMFKKSVTLYLSPGLMTLNVPILFSNICGTYSWSGDTLYFFPRFHLGVNNITDAYCDTIKQNDDYYLFENRIYTVNCTGDTLTEIKSNTKYILKR